MNREYKTRAWRDLHVDVVQVKAKAVAICLNVSRSQTGTVGSMKCKN